MSLTAILSIVGVLMTFAGMIIRWRIIRGAKKAGKDEQALEQMRDQAEDYKKINEMAGKEDEAMFQRLEKVDDDDGGGPGPWVPDRRRKSGK